MKIDGPRLRAAREAAGKTPQEAAAISDMSESSISRIETRCGEKAQDLNMHICRAFAKAYNVPVRSFEERQP